MLHRCPWAEGSDLERAYHDEEWGLPCRDDRRLFEFIILETAQAGLSWRTILNKREGYRQAFAGFDPEVVARFGPQDVERLLADVGIIRNRKKVEAAIANARATLKVQEQPGGLAGYFWNFVDGRPLVNHWQELAEVPASTPLSTALAKDMKARGFAFMGPTTAYAHMQAVGMVNDHLVTCFRHAQCAAVDVQSARSKNCQAPSRHPR